MNPFSKLLNNKKATIALAVAVFVFGAFCVAYPYISDYLAKVEQMKVVQSHEDSQADVAGDALQVERDRAAAYNAELLAGRTVVTDPFDPDREQLPTERYESLMNLADDGIMATLCIPKIRATLPVYHGTSDEVLDQGVGHLEATSLPWGGESSHSVLAGHSGLSSVKVFDALGQVEVGDYFVLRVLGEDHAYRVYSVEVVLPSETESLLIEQGRDLCTLVTCTPYGINSHRLLVHGERCDVPQEWIDLQESGASNAVAPTFVPGLALFTAVGIVVSVGLVILANRLLAGRRARQARSDGEAGGAGRRGGHAR